MGASFIPDLKLQTEPICTPAPSWEDICLPVVQTSQLLCSYPDAERLRMGIVRWLSRTDVDVAAASQLARLRWLHELRMQRYDDAAETLLHVSADPTVRRLLQAVVAWTDETGILARQQADHCGQALHIKLTYADVT